VGQDNRASQITENSAHYLREQILPGIRGDGISMKNKKSKCIAIIFLLLPLISQPPVLAQSADSSPKWDQPFDKPMYLLHTNEAKHYDSSGKEFTVPDQRWILYPNNVESVDAANPKASGKIGRYIIDRSMGPYNTPREACSATWYPYIIQGNNFVLLNCKDMPAQPEKPDKPEEGPCVNACDKSKHLVWDGYEGCNCICENGWKFDEHGNCVIDTSELEEDLEGGIEVATSQGTTMAKPGEKVQIITVDGERVAINAKCREMIRATTLLYISQDLFKSKTMSASYGYIICLILTACKRLEFGEPIKSQKTAEFAEISSSYSADYLAKLELGLQSGSLRIETVHDQVALDVKTPTMTVSSAGKNTFGVAYDLNSESSLLSAYQNPIHIQPSNSNLAPFTLGSGQRVEVSSEGIGPVTPLDQVSGGTEGSTHVSPDGRDIYGTVGGAGNAADQTGVTSEVSQGGCYTDPSTDQMICVDRIGDSFNPEGGNQEQGGCYADPQTGEIICVDAFGEITNPSSSMGTAHTMQPDAGSSVPQSLQECETYTSEICGTWTRMGDQFNAQWDNGASAMLNVERWDNGAVVLTRHDTEGSSAGLTARYEGRCTGNHVDGTVTWTWNGSTWSGTWSANW
jgi:hypothetical protein